MAHILLMSSFTAASHVGSIVSAFVLRRMGMTVTVLPTTLFGRHPGWGQPGGQIIPTETLSTMWDAIRAQSEKREVPFDAIMTGYMGEVGHVELAATIIDAVSPATVLVDPVMGDGSRAKGGLYISPERAEAICDQLIPRAHIATPNLWEWRYITGSLNEPDQALPRPLTGLNETVVTSVADKDRIGVMLFSGEKTYQIMHERFDGVPNGGGDTLAATYLGQRLRGDEPKEALCHSVSAIFAMMKAYGPNDFGEFPIIRTQHYLDEAGGVPDLKIESFHD